MQRAACLFAALGISFVPAPTALAQLPIPELGDAPDLRIASADEFYDRLRSTRQRIARTAEERAPEIESLRQQLIRQLELEQSGAAAERFDAAAAQRLLEQLEAESGLLKSAVALANRAADVTAQEPTSPPEGTTLDDVVAVAEDVRRQRRVVREQQRLARRLRALGTTPVAPLERGGSIAEQAVHQQQRLQDAQIDVADARALEAEAAVRSALDQLVLLRTAWTPTTDLIQSAESGVVEAERTTARALRRIRSQRTRTASVSRARFGGSELEQEARRSELRSRLASLDYAQDRAESRVTRARARLATARRRAGLATADADLGSSALTIRVFATDQATARVETHLSQLPETYRTRRQRRAVEREREALLTSLESLRDTKSDLERALVYAEIREGPTEASRRSTRSRELGFALSLLVLLAAVFLLARGFKWGQTLLARAQASLPSAVRLTNNQVSRLKTVAVLLWPIVVAAVAAALLIWPVWNLSLTIGEALRLFDRPLFFVDETGVSVLSLVKFAFALYAANVLSRAVREFMQTRVYPQTDWDIGLTTALDTLVYYSTMIVGLIVGLRFVGVGFSALAILAGLLGIGIGFGLRNITENFISGLIVLAERPIKIGDFIEMGSGNLEGQVRRIRARSTTVVTRDNISIIIPNSEFVAGRVTNWSHGDPRVRIAIEVGVAYGSDVDLVRKALLDVAGRHGQVLSRPLPEVEFKAFGGSSLDFVLRAWIEQQADRFRIASDLRFAIDAAFRKRSIEIAFPQLDLHFKSVQAPLLSALTNSTPVPPDPEPASGRNEPGKASPPVEPAKAPDDAH